MKRETDTSIYVGHLCQACGKRVLMSGEGSTSAFWRTDPKTGEVKAWHLKAPCWPPVEKAA